MYATHVGEPVGEEEGEDDGGLRLHLSERSDTGYMGVYQARS